MVTPDYMAQAMVKCTAELEVYKKKERLLTWCATECVSMAVGVDAWGPTVKCTNLMTDKALVQGDISGKRRSLCPQQARHSVR